MIKHITILTALMMVVAIMWGGSVAAEPIDVLNAACKGRTNAVCTSGSDDVYGLIKNVISILVTIVAFVSVIMIIVGGIQYATSGGDASQTKKAKDTVIYAVVGLVISIMAYAIVNWVIGKV